MRRTTPGSVPRRRLLKALGAGSVVSASHLWAPRWVGASDLSLSGRIDLLYSNQFHFNRRGEPQITIGLMQGQRRVRLSAPRGLDVLPSGDNGTRIESSSRIQVRLVDGHPAQQRYAIVLQAVAGADPRTVRQATQRWADRGLSPREREVGTVFGVDGRVIDTRQVLLTTGEFDSERSAKTTARDLVDRHGALGRLHPLSGRRGRGRLVAEDLDRGTVIHADGVLWFAPRGSGPITVHDVLSGTTMGPGRRSDRQYSGDIYIAIDRHGMLTVVNLVSESDLLAGLVPAEIYASAPMSALCAQAVAARCHLIGKVGTRHLDDPFLLCADQHCQVYAGRGHEHPRTTKAVRATAGRVLMRPGGTQLVDTVYSANCGGHSEDNDAVWPSPPDPQLRGRPDPLLPSRYEDGFQGDDLHAWLHHTPPSYSRPESPSGAESYRWIAHVDPTAIAGHGGVPADFGPVRAMEVLARGRSARATALRLRGSGQSMELRGELTIRRALGGLKSSMFIVDPQPDRYGRFRLIGGGHGHGVGLCQHGAMGMARAGRPYEEILAHYYRGASVDTLW